MNRHLVDTGTEPYDGGNPVCENSKTRDGRHRVHVTVSYYDSPLTYLLTLNPTSDTVLER